MADLTATGNTVVRVVGLVLEDPATGKPILVGRFMDKTDNTDKNDN
jgi:hypothetical protein